MNFLSVEQIWQSSDLIQQWAKRQLGTDLSDLKGKGALAPPGSRKDAKRSRPVPFPRAWIDDIVSPPRGLTLTEADQVRLQTWILDQVSEQVGDTNDNQPIERLSSDARRAVAESAAAMVQLLQTVIARASAVAQISARGAWGSGFLLDSDSSQGPVLVTARHVFEDEETAREARISFNTFNANGQSVNFMDCRALPGSWKGGLGPIEEADWALVRIEPMGGGKLPAPLRRASKEAVKDDPVSMIHFPLGGIPQMSSKWLRITEVVSPSEVHYDLDTSGGSSGAPVLDARWEVVAVHSQAGPVADLAGTVDYNIGTPIGRVIV